MVVDAPSNDQRGYRHIKNSPGCIYHAIGHINIVIGALNASALAVAKPISCGFRAKLTENSSLVPAMAPATATAGRLASAPSIALRDSSFFVMSGPWIGNRHDNGNPLFARTDGQSGVIE